MINLKKNWLKIVLIICAVLLVFMIGYRIVAKTLLTSKKPKTLEYTVGTQLLKKEKIEETLYFKGILEGDPQVEIYSNVTGNFIRNNVELGSYIYQGQVIASIDRAIIGAEYRPALITSPISGTVTKLYFVDRGTFVMMNSPVAEIANISDVKVVLNIGEEFLLRLQKGMAATIYSVYDPEARLKASVTSVTPFIDQDSFTGTVQVKALNPRNILKVGMTVNIEIFVGEINAFMIPSSAVTVGLNKQYVFINNNGIAKEVDVVLGYVSGDKVEIIGKLNEGDEVIVDGSFKIYDGAKIEVLK
jgi:multidrug efflux pump subunit AcrA (membrane-fusion protein)